MNPYWLSFAETGAQTLWLWSWQAAILLTCVWAGLKLLRVESPALRHHVWLLGLLAVTLLPVAPRLLPEAAAPQWQTPTLRYVATLPQQLIVAPSPVNAPNATATLPAPRVWSFSAIAFVLWFGSACLMLARLLYGFVRMHRVRRNAMPVTAAELGYVEASVPLCLTDKLHSPVLSGVLRPLILLPQDFCTWTTAEERCAMIEHELAHIRRRDHYTNVLLNALHVVFYFHPLVRLACRHIRLEREIACDDCVVSAGADATVYAESILKAAERSLLQPSLAASQQPAFFSNKQTLERRIEMIMNATRIRVVQRQWRFLALSMALIGGLVWFLLPSSLTKTGLAQALPSNTTATAKLLQEMVGSKNFGLLLSVALHNSNPELRQQAVQKLFEVESSISTPLLLELFRESHDQTIQANIIREFGRRKETEALTQISYQTNNSKLLTLMLEQVSSIAWRDNAINNEQINGAFATTLKRLISLKTKEQISEAVNETFNEAFDQSKNGMPPPPPPPPHPSMMSVEAGKPLEPLPGHPNDQSVFAVLRQLADAQIRGDMATNDALLSDEFTGITANGEKWNKAEAMAESRKIGGLFTKFVFDDVNVSANERLAVATFLGTIYHTADGKEMVLQQGRYTVTLSKLQANGPWRIVSSHLTRKM